jgi:diguanylate cyclase (GGDEF)-like protein
MMHLDVPTLMVMGSLVAASAGAVLLVAWLQDRKLSILALWGLADIATAGGVFSLMLGSALHQPLVTALGGSLVVLAQGLIWKAVRTFDAKPAPLVLALLGMAIVGLASAIPGLRNISGSLGLALSSVYLFAAATALWLGRKERLAARWPIMAFTGVHAAILLIGAYSTFDIYNAYDLVPPLISLFGFIHFENNIFVVATAVFILALVKERNEAASRLAAQTDPLTGIANRSAFMDRAERVVERCRRESAPVSVMMFDLDRFKTVNDTYGHAVGDAVIRKFCEVTAAALWPSDVFGRIGGEEFAVVLPGSSIEAAYVRAERIRVSFAENCRFVGDHQVNTTVSGGVSISVNGEQTLSMLLEYSDIALYRAKDEGRNRIKRADQPKLEGDLSTVLRVA